MIKKDEPNSYDLISSKDADICKCENSLTTNTTITTTKSTSSPPPPKSPRPPHNARLLADTKVEEGIDIVGNHYECAASCCSLSLLACGGCQRGDASSEETIMISSKSSTTQEKMKSQPQQPQSEQQSNETNHNLSKSITTSKNEESVLSFPLLQSSGPEGTSMVMSMSSPAMSSSSSSLLAEEVSRLQTENKSLKAQLRRCKMKLKQYERRERQGEANHIDKDDDSDFGYHSHVEHRNIHIDTQQDSDDTLRTNHRRRTQNNKVHEHVHVEQTIASIGKRRTGFLTPSRSESLSRHHRRRRSRRSRRRNCCIQSHHQTIQHNNSNPGTTTHLNMSMDDMDLLFSGFASPPTITRSKYTRRQSSTSPPTRLSITQESSSTHTSSHRLQSHSKTHTNRHKSRSSSLSSTTSFSSQQKHNENKPKQTSTCTLSNEQFWKELTMRHINTHPPAAAARRRDSIYNPDIDDDERTTTSKDQDTRIVDTCHTPQSITVTSTHASSDMENNENDSKKKGLYERTKKHSSSEVLHMLSQMNLPLPDISVTPSDAVQEQWTNQSQKGRGKENKQDGEEGQIDHYNSIGTTSTTTGTMTMATTAVPSLFPSTIMGTSTTHQELDPTPTTTTTNTTTTAAAAAAATTTTTTSGSSSTPTVTSWNLWGIFGDSDIMAEHPYDGEILRNYNDDQGPEQTRQGGRVTKKHKGGIIRTTSSTRTANTAASAPRKTMLVPKRLLS